jgi:hypothetical protein
VRLWYQYYFHTERGRNGLTQKRRELCRLLWKMWSPTWAFDDATFGRTAGSFDNADFVDVVIHSYRHRTGNAAGDPRHAPVEARLAAQPRIDVPTINLHGAVDGVTPVGAWKATANISPRNTSAAFWRMSATIRRRRRRRLSPTRSCSFAEARRRKIFSADAADAAGTRRAR